MTPNRLLKRIGYARRTAQLSDFHHRITLTGGRSAPTWLLETLFQCQDVIKRRFNGVLSGSLTRDLPQR